MTEAQRDTKWFVYMIVTDRQALYTGITTDIQRRFQEHLDVSNGVVKSKGAKFFRAQKPLSVRYQKSFADRSGASKHEYWLKRLPKMKKLALVEGCSEVIGI